jgi:DNA replication protein DnaC
MMTGPWSVHATLLTTSHKSTNVELNINEFGYLDLRPEQSNIFFKLMEERYHRHSTIVTTNLGYDEWQNFLGNKSMVEALLSRVRHYCHTVTINGPSLREPQG